jgi:hypothetical protein
MRDSGGLCSKYQIADRKRNAQRSVPEPGMMTFLSAHVTSRFSRTTTPARRPTIIPPM